MDYIYVGDCVNTHGLKGEVRILSSFKFKENAFKPGNKIYIGSSHDELTISTYRKHKEFDMLKFDGLDSIEDVLIYKTEPVYVDRNQLEYDGYLNEDLMGLDVYNEDKVMGKVTGILKTDAHDILIVQNGKKHMIPNVSEFVKEVNLDDGYIRINYIKGLVDED